MEFTHLKLKSNFKIFRHTHTYYVCIYIESRNFYKESPDSKKKTGKEWSGMSVVSSLKKIDQNNGVPIMV